MFSKRFINVAAATLLLLFVVQSAYDLYSIDYEVDGQMYLIISAVVTGMFATNIGVNLSDKAKRVAEALQDEDEEPVEHRQTPTRPRKNGQQERRIIDRMKKVPIQELFPEEEDNDTT